MSRSDGSTADYYVLPEGATQLQDLISHRDMNSQIGEIFRACYRYGIVSHSDKMRDAKKIRFYAQAEVERLEKFGQVEQEAHIGYKDEEPSHIQVGDKVVCLVGQQDMTEGRVYVVTRIGSGDDCAPFKVIDDVGDEWCLSRHELRKLGDAQ